VAVGLSASSEDTRGLEGNINAKLAITPHRGSTVMVRKNQKGNDGSWHELAKQFTGNFKSTYKRPASTEELKACTQKSGESLCSYIHRWSIIKNSAEDVSNERAIDAFVLGLHR
jgi:hypothetical protein